MDTFSPRLQNTLDEFEKYMADCSGTMTLAELEAFFRESMPTIQ